ncbi:MAG: GTP-binding protein [Salinivirgaceae bacterium]|nr:GTP-binding protein [Salinivirgaceae bacterium]
MANNGYLDMQLLRFTTAGSVDDGKSTLIGRLLYDSKSIFEDQMEAVETASKSRGNEEVNLALLTDGLRAEREQGITIDVAYRYFATPRRKFIIADTPGHIEYTRNMVTGASTADLAVILVDARHGIMEQTIRHSYVAALLAIKQIVVCVNKMDLVDFSEDVFAKIVADYKAMSAHLPIGKVDFIPISAKLGDNVVNKSANMQWFNGKPLLEFLETVEIQNDTEEAFRMAVQYVIRPISDKYADFRGYAGRIASGKVKVGDSVRVLPSGQTSAVASLWFADKQLTEAVEGDSVTVCLKDDIDISRGDVLCADNGNLPEVGQAMSLNICWFRETPLQLGKRYIVRHATQEVVGMFKAIDYKIDINSQDKIADVSQLIMNDIAHVQLKTASPLVFEPYHTNKVMGSLIIVDPDTNDTLGAGMIDL